MNTRVQHKNIFIQGNILNFNNLNTKNFLPEDKKAEYFC